jgi:uncharacterized protein YycO
MKNKMIIISIIALFILMFFNSSGAINNQIDKKNESISKYVVPPSIQVGDIVFMEIDNYYCKIPGWDHCGIYVGNNEFIHASGYLNCVVKQNISFFEQFDDVEIVYGKVITSNEEQRINAINFAEGQIGKPYNARESKNPSFDSQAWYCSELVWAAYLNQEIDLDINGWNFPHYVGTIEICWDDDVEMYTSHELNQWHPGFFISWSINYMINWPKNHKYSV